MSETDSLLQERTKTVVHSTCDDDQVKAILGFEQAVLTNATREAFKKLQLAYNQFQPAFSFGMLFYIFLVGEVRKNLNENEGWVSKPSAIPLSEKGGTRLTFSRGDDSVGNYSCTPQTKKDYPLSTIRKVFNVNKSSQLDLFVNNNDTPIEVSETWIYLYNYDKQSIKFEISKPTGYTNVNDKTGVIDQWDTRIIIDDFDLDKDEREFLERNEKVAEEEFSLEEK